MLFFIISIVFLFVLLVFFYLFFEKSDLEKDIAANKIKPGIGKLPLLSPRKKTPLKVHTDTGVNIESK